MASSRSSVVEFDDKDVSSDLQFHDFSHDEVATLKPSENFTTYPENSNFSEETEGLLTEEKKSSSIWEFSYYQSFFDVDTDQVLRRILWSMIPLPGRATYLDRQVRPNPDLYGPFWISTTLIISSAVTTNIANYFMLAGNNKMWHYDFHKVTLAAAAIYSYVFIVPVALWALLWYRQSLARYTLLEILSVYGYSLFIYIPISILWVVQVPWFQWLVVLIGTALSGLVLIQSFLPILKNENKKVAAVVLCSMLLFHALLIFSFMGCFFRSTYPNEISVLPSSISASSSVSTNSSHVETHIPSKVNRDVMDQLNNTVHTSSKMNLYVTSGFNSTTLLKS